jgi:hypothetical protein
MQVLLYALLFFPLLLHSYVIVKRNPQPKKALLLDSHRSKADNEMPLDSPIMALEVDACMLKHPT